MPIIGPLVRILVSQALKRAVPVGRRAIRVDSAAENLRNLAEELDIPDLEDADNEERARVVREAERRGIATEREIEELTRDMPVTYEDWISIAFETAKDKGADFSTTQAQIQRGQAPTSGAIKVFAAIWQSRKEEIERSARSARQVADEEIEV